MDLDFSDELKELREEARRFVQQKASGVPREVGLRSPEPGKVPLYRQCRQHRQHRQHRQWMAAPFTAGCLGASWPAELRGRPDRDPLEVFVVD